MTILASLFKGKTRKVYLKEKSMVDKGLQKFLYKKLVRDLEQVYEYRIFCCQKFNY